MNLKEKTIEKKDMLENIRLDRPNQITHKVISF